MKRILMMVFRNILLVPYMWIKLCYHASHVDKYTEEERIVLTVRPGITGYNQAVNRNSVLTKEKLKNDIYYVKHLSVGFDIKILFMTVATVLGHKNINRADTDTGNTYILNSNETAATKETVEKKQV